MEKKFQNKILRLVKDDITERKVDAIVNAANSYLKHGGGVARAIVTKGGKTIQQESDKIGYVPVGSTALTTAGLLPSSWVIHAVGPKMGEGDEVTKLHNVLRNILELATQKQFKSISIPAISSGIFGFPKDKCAKILIEESVKYVRTNKESCPEIIEFCILDNETYDYFEKELTTT